MGGTLGEAAHHAVAEMRLAADGDARIERPGHDSSGFYAGRMTGAGSDRQLTD
jgi:hypothetical protein